MTITSVYIGEANTIDFVLNAYQKLLIILYTNGKSWLLMR